MRRKFVVLSTVATLASCATAAQPPSAQDLSVQAVERQSHYFETDLAQQYDAVIHIDRTTAVEPLRSSR